MQGLNSISNDAKYNTNLIKKGVKLPQQLHKTSNILQVFLFIQYSVPFSMYIDLTSKSKDISVIFF